VHNHTLTLLDYAIRHAARDSAAAYAAVLRAASDLAGTLARGERHHLLRVLGDHEPGASAGLTLALWRQAVTALSAPPTVTVAELLNFHLPDPDGDDGGGDAA
jgi:hypothetical protein